MDFLIFLFVLVGWAYLYSRLRRTEDRLEQDAEARAELTRRIWELERSQTVPAAETPAPPAVEPFTPPRPLVFEPPSVVIPPLEPVTETTSVPEPVFTTSPLFGEQAAPPPTWRDQIRESMGGQEWEAVVGGNWLNKLGVLVLVIGIALLLGYEFTRVGPLGRVAIGMAVGLTMLIGGVLIERKRAYAIFARGLIGGGWAALYFTTYAMHALPAAKVIDNPYLATALAVGRRLRHDFAFAPLQIANRERTGLLHRVRHARVKRKHTILSSGALAASRVVAVPGARFEWNQMAVFGFFATYATVASRPDAGAPLAIHTSPLRDVLAAFRDVRSLPSSAEHRELDHRLLHSSDQRVRLPRPLDREVAALFAGASLCVLCRRRRPLYGEQSAARASAAAVHVRGRSSTLDRIAGGSYEGPITFSAALAGVAILLRAAGEWMNLSLLVEGEILFLAGFVFGQKYLRQLAGAAFIGSVTEVVLVDQSAAESITLAGRTFASWSPIAALSAAVFYFNRIAARQRGDALQLGRGRTGGDGAGLRDAAPISECGVAGLRRNVIRNGFSSAPARVPIPGLHHWSAWHRRRSRHQLARHPSIRGPIRLDAGVAATRHLRRAALCRDASDQLERRRAA